MDKRLEQKVLVFHPAVETTSFTSMFCEYLTHSKHMIGVKYQLPLLFTNRELRVMEGRIGDIWTQERIPAFFQS